MATCLQCDHISGGGATYHAEAHANKPSLFSIPIAVTKGRHEMVPKDIREEAEKYAKVRSRSHLHKPRLFSFHGNPST